MKSIYKSIIVLTFVVIFQLQLMKVDAIRCFQCNSNNNSGCTNLENYKRNLFYPKPCEDYEGRAAFCRKTVIQVLDKVKQNEKRVIRSCGYIPYKNPCYKTDNEGHTEQVCQCFEDGCNSANTIAMSAFLVLSTYLLTKAM